MSSLSTCQAQRQLLSCQHRCLQILQWILHFGTARTLAWIVILWELLLKENSLQQPEAQKWHPVSIRICSEGDKPRLASPRAWCTIFYEQVEHSLARQAPLQLPHLPWGSTSQCDEFNLPAHSSFRVSSVCTIKILLLVIMDVSSSNTPVPRSSSPDNGLVIPARAHPTWLFPAFETWKAK